MHVVAALKVFSISLIAGALERGNFVLGVVNGEDPVVGAFVVALFDPCERLLPENILEPCVSRSLSEKK